MLIIQQGDQYSIGITLTDGGATVTPATVDDVRIQIGNTLKSYAESELTFDELTKEWLYPLTQEETVALEGATVPLQVGIRRGLIIHYSETMNVLVGKSIIKKGW